jgi:hypothetical protein
MDLLPKVEIFEAMQDPIQFVTRKISMHCQNCFSPDLVSANLTLFKPTDVVRNGF